MKSYVLSFLTFLLGIITYSQENFTVQELSVNTWIDGDLYISKTIMKDSPLIIIIPGSGPTDRNGNQQMMQTNAYKLLAEGLSNNGINVFTYDKKFFKQIQAGEFKEEELTFDEGVNDVEEIVKFFKKEKKFKNIYLVGHSEGSLVGILTAQKVDLAGLISIAGLGKPIDEILIEQISKQAPFLVEETKNILKELKEGKKVEIVNPYLISLFRKEVQPFMISWLKYNPKNEIAKLKMPVLIIQGNKDIQVPKENADILHQSLSNSELVLIENMNHVLKDISGDEAENMASYNQPELAVSEKLVNEIFHFITSNGK